MDSRRTVSGRDVAVLLPAYRWVAIVVVTGSMAAMGRWPAVLAARGGRPNGTGSAATDARPSLNGR